MSFLGGAECSTSRNPLAQFTKHVSEDKSLQRDRLGGLPAGPDVGGLRSMGGEMAAADKQVCIYFYFWPSLHRFFSSGMLTAMALDG